MAWRHNGSGTYGLCVRGFYVVPGQYAIEWLGPSYEVENVDRTPFFGVGGVRVRHHSDLLTVVYSNSDHDEFNGCPGGLEMRWFSNSSPDFGHSWSASHQIFDSHDFNWCFGRNTLTQGFRSFSFDVDFVGTYWAAIVESPNRIRVFYSIDRTNWVADTVFTTAAVRTMGHPAIAGDGRGNIGLSFYETDTNNTPRVSRWFAARSSDLTQPWSVALPIETTFDIPTAASGRGLGDYQGMSAVNPDLFPGADGGTFFPVWTGRAASGLVVRGAFVSYTP